MIILPEDFELSVDDLKMRLVTTGDAEFITSLRSNPKRTSYMVTLDNDIEQQKRWIEEYKRRERKGLDYYFIYFLKNKKIGVYRISHIDFDEKKAKSANWIKVPSERKITALMFYLHKYVIFEILQLNWFYTDIFQKNKKPLSYYQEFEYPLPKKPNSRGFLDIRVHKKDYINSKKDILEKYHIKTIRNTSN